jgi:hypothetical protein
MWEGAFKPHEAAAFLTLLRQFNEELTALTDSEALLKHLIRDSTDVRV